jgi:tetratricopeptide (TPR) repeat protein
MAVRPHKAKPAVRPLRQDIQQDGLFTGTAQAGAARQRRAHALAEELVARGCLYLQKQIWDEAAREFNKAIQMEADYAEAYNNLGLTLMYMNKLTEAVEHLQYTLRLFPGWHIAEANLGLAYMRLGRYEEAVQQFERALAQKPQCPVYLALGDCLAALNRVDQAITAYNKAKDLFPKSDLAYYRIGMLQARQNRIDEAEVALSKSLELRPGNAEAIAVLGAIAARKGNLARARDCFKQVIGQPKPPAPAQRGYHRLGIFDKGMQKGFAEWKAGSPTPSPLAECYYNLGLALLQSGNRAGAKDAFQQAASANPNWVEPLVWFGFFAATDGDGLSARRYWEAATKLRPDLGLVLEQLGYLAVAMGLQKDGEASFAGAAKCGRPIPKEDIYPDQTPRPAAPAAEEAEEDAPYADETGVAE